MTLSFALHSIYLHFFFIIFTHFCVAAHKLTFPWIFSFFRSLMTIIELNNCPLFSFSLSIWFSFKFFLTFHEILSLSHKTTHSALNYHNFPSDQILELTLVRLCAANLKYVRFFVFTLKELAVLFYYTILRHFSAWTNHAALRQFVKFFTVAIFLF